VELPAERFDAAAEAAAYYVFLEAVTNAQKHAPHALVSVRVHATTRALTIEVSDDGPGGADEASGSGLKGLRERVEAGGGAFHLQSGAQGTKVVGVLPL
jgi:signal transduction histidine kinase